MHVGHIGCEAITRILVVVVVGFSLIFADSRFLEVFPRFRPSGAAFGPQGRQTRWMEKTISGEVVVTSPAQDSPMLDVEKVTPGQGIYLWWFTVPLCGSLSASRGLARARRVKHTSSVCLALWAG